MQNVFVTNTPTRKVLKTALQKDVTVYRNFFMPLCSILWDPDKEFWMLEHFNNIYYIKDKSGYTWLDYLEPNGFTEDVLNITSRLYEDIKSKDIVKLLKKQIDNGLYSTIFVDEFYLNGIYKDTRHLVSEMFITGYDDDEKKFFGIGYTDSREVDYITFTYDEIRIGFASLTTGVVDIEDCPVWVKLFTMQAYKLLDINNGKTADIEAFKRDIRSYYTSEEHPELLRSQNVKEFGADAIYGIKAQEVVLQAIRDLLKGEFKTDYRHIHLISEHKKMLVKKFTYIDKNIHPVAKTILDGSKTVSMNIELSRILYLKSAMQEGNMYAALKNETTIKKIVSLIEKAITEERVYLEEYLNS